MTAITTTELHGRGVLIVINHEGEMRLICINKLVIVEDCADRAPLPGSDTLIFLRNPHVETYFHGWGTGPPRSLQI